MKLDRKTCVRVGVSVFVLYLCVHYWPVAARLLKALLSAAAPILLGCVIAYVVNIPMSFFERHFPKSENKRLCQLRRGVSLALALISLAAVVGLIVVIVAPELVTCVTMLVAQVPQALMEISQWLAGIEWLEGTVVESLAHINWPQLVQQVIDVVVSGFGNVANGVMGIVNSVLSWTVTVTMGAIVGLYILLGKERLEGQFKALFRRYLPEKIRRGGRHVWDVMNECFHKYIVGQCTEAVILGCLCALGMALLGFPYAAVVGATVGFTALIPVAGAYIGGAVGFLLILTVSPIRAVLFVVYLNVLQQLEGNLIYPKVVGTSLGLPSIWVLAAVIIGGGMFGVFGMILGVPLAAGCYKLLKEDVAQGPRSLRNTLKQDPPST